MAARGAYYPQKNIEGGLVSVRLLLLPLVESPHPLQYYVLRGVAIYPRSIRARNFLEREKKKNVPHTQIKY